MTNLQKRFAEEYTVDYSAAKAGRRAGIQGDNVGVTAWQMLQLPDVQEYVQQLQAEAALRCHVSKDELLREFKKVGFSNITNYLHNDLDVKYLSEVEVPEAIKSIKKTVKSGENGTDITVEITLHDKLSALTSIGRHIGFFSEDNAQKNAIFQIMNVDPLTSPDEDPTNYSPTEDSQS
jgi:hypothetical protein